MFSHLVTFEKQLKQYKIEFKYNGREIKTVYINGLDVNWSRLIMLEIQKFYRDDAPEFEKKLKGL